MLDIASRVSKIKADKRKASENRKLREQAIIERNRKYVKKKLLKKNVRFVKERQVRKMEKEEVN